MSTGNFGTVQVGGTYTTNWPTTNSAGASVTRTTDGTIRVYKDDDTSGVTTGVTDVEDFNSLTGVHQVVVDTSADSTFYSLGSKFHIVLEGAVIDSQTVNHPIDAFTIGELIGVTSTASDNADNLSIANRALLFLGEKTITSFSDNSKRAETANLLFNPARDSVLEAHTWKSARKLAALTQDTTYTGTAGSWSASVATLTIGTHTVDVGDTIKVAGWVPTGYNGDYEVTAVTATTVSYSLANDPGSATTFGTVLDPVVPAWGFNNQYSLPSDFVRHVINEDQSVTYEIHGNKLLTNASSVNMEYVFDLTTVSDMNATLREAFAAKLALDMSFKLDTSKGKQEAMERLFDRAVARARNIDAAQRTDDRVVSDEWLVERLTTNDGFRTLGPVPTE